MEQVYLQTLILLFPILFIFHDFEEIIMAEKWIQHNSSKLNRLLPKKMAARVMKHFSMTTAQFAAAVLVIFLFVSSSTIFANQFLISGPFGNIHYFLVIALTFFVHAFTHIGQSILLRSVTPGVITSVIIILPYSWLLFHALLENNIITWKMIFICLPFSFLLIPVTLFAHWVGRKIA